MVYELGPKLLKILIDNNQQRMELEQSIDFTATADHVLDAVMKKLFDDNIAESISHKKNIYMRSGDSVLDPKRFRLFAPRFVDMCKQNGLKATIDIEGDIKIVISDLIEYLEKLKKLSEKIETITTGAYR